MINASDQATVCHAWDRCGATTLRIMIFIPPVHGPD
jgi:hypothetical protein